jgi:hypothetical protein
MHHDVSGMSKRIDEDQFRALNESVPEFSDAAKKQRMRRGV